MLSVNGIIRAGYVPVLVCAGLLYSHSASAATQDVFYSVGQNTSDHKSGSPTVSISSGTATFSVAQTGNMGVGDQITYDTSSVAYIKSKTSFTVWDVTTASGGMPADVTDKTVNSIAHAFNSLSSAVANASDSSHLNSSDLTASGADVKLHLALYDDGGR